MRKPGLLLPRKHRILVDIVIRFTQNIDSGFSIRNDSNENDQENNKTDNKRDDDD